VAGAKLLLHLLTVGNYGIFRDEMYYVACSFRLDWGFVDHPPLTPVIAWLTTHLFGRSPLAVRVFPALAGAALVWLTGKLARDMGGGRFAQFLAALAVLISPIYLLSNHWLTDNAWEPLMWMGCIWLVIRAINTGDERCWLWFGLLAGVAFENKYSIAFLLLGVLVGVILRPERKFLASGWLWLGVVGCILINLPNMLWQVYYHFPFMELIHNIRVSNRDIVRGPVAFVLDQAMIMNPILFPLWAVGLMWFFLSLNGKRYRVLGWTFLVVLGTLIAMGAKNYYVTPVYPMMFAAGAIGFEEMMRRRHSLRWGVAYTAVAIVGAIAIAPDVVPILPPQKLVRYLRVLHLEDAGAFERQNNGALPQWFADEFGWQEMVAKVAEVYNSLPAEERARTAIFSNGWGEAAAVDFYGPKYGLPRAISKQNSYWIWGPGHYDGRTMIVLRSSGEGDREHFESVEDMGAVGHPFARRDEFFHVWLCRGPKFNLQEAWAGMKLFD
jgi:hypothetical protein